jgi:antirestriction protein
MFVIVYTNFACLFVIIKLDFPSNFLQNIAPSNSRNDVVQAEEYHDQANEDLMEEDDGTNHVNDPMEEDDGTNQMIQDFISQPDEDGDNAGSYDEPLLENSNK